MFDQAGSHYLIREGSSDSLAPASFNLDEALKDVARQFDSLPKNVFSPEHLGGKWRTAVAQVRRADQALLMACEQVNHTIEQIVKDASLISWPEFNQLCALDHTDPIAKALRDFQLALENVTVEDFSLYLGERKSKGGVRIKDKVIATAVHDFEQKLETFVPTSSLKRQDAKRRLLALIVGKALVAGSLMQGSVAMSAGPLPAGIPAQIIPDGKTLTTLQTQGTRTTINTATMVGKSALNSFQKFDVYSGNTVNLVVPTQAANLVNLVRQGVTNIDGVLNSYKNGQIGGNVYMLNPNGVVIGASGVVNTGSLVIAAPAMKVIDSLYKDTGFDEDAVKRLAAGEIPLTGGGRVSISGTVNATGGVSIGGSTVSIDGAIHAAGKYEGLSLATNTGGASTAESLEVVDGKILVRADQRLDVAGTLDVSQSVGKAGQIDLRSGGDLNLNAGAQLLAKGTGSTASGGEIKTWADRKASLNVGALMDVSAAGTGDGGWLEFSAQNVELAGGALRASSAAGQQGSALIDPAQSPLATICCVPPQRKGAVQMRLRASLGVPEVCPLRQLQASH